MGTTLALIGHAKPDNTSPENTLSLERCEKELERREKELEGREKELEGREKKDFTGCLATKGWNTRWFNFNETEEVLCYYKKNNRPTTDENKPRGRIIVENMKNITCDEGLCLQILLTTGKVYKIKLSDDGLYYKLLELKLKEFKELKLIEFKKLAPKASGRRLSETECRLRASIPGLFKILEVESESHHE